MLLLTLFRYDVESLTIREFLTVFFKALFNIQMQFVESILGLRSSFINHLEAYILSSTNNRPLKMIIVPI